MRYLGLLALLGTTGCLVAEECDAAPFYACTAGVVSQQGCGSSMAVTTCAKGCGITRMSAALDVCPGDLCLENVPKKAGDGCQTDDDCRPVPAESSTTTITNTYLACDTAAHACIATAGPTVADWLKPCSPDVVARIGPAGSTRAFDRGAPDPGCAEGWCAAARVEGAACIANSCTRACTSDDQCPGASTCILFVNGTNACVAPMGWCKPGGPAGIGFTCT